MTTGSGLDAQLGFASESVAWGTPATVDHFVEFLTESLQREFNFIEPAGLRPGIKFKRGSRLTRSRQSVSGGVELEHTNKTMGLLWKMALGSTITAPTLVLGSAYKQVHTPGDYMAKSLTMQVGRPEPSGAVRPHTFSGCKITGWEFTISDGENAKLSLEIDGQAESTVIALATSAYASAAEVFDFMDVSVFKLGGTASTASGEVSIAGGVSVASVVKGITIKGTTPLANERFGLGNAGLKREQLENEVPTIEVTLDAEYSKAEFYDVFANGTATALELKMEGSTISGTDKNTLSFIIPSMVLKNAAPAVGGADIVQAQVGAEVYSDGTNAPIQVKLISPDVTL